MPKLNRGDKFGGYYSVDPANPAHLYGIQWLHAFPCGEGITFFVLYKDEFPDCKGQNAEAVDFSVDSVDYLGEQPVFQHLLADYLPAEVIATLHPIAQYLVNQDLQEGLSCEEILNKRAAILVPEFLGFTYEQIPDEYKTVTTVTDENGGEVIVQDIRRCSLEEA